MRGFAAPGLKLRISRSDNQCQILPPDPPMPTQQMFSPVATAPWFDQSSPKNDPGPFAELSDCVIPAKLAPAAFRPRPGVQKPLVELVSASAAVTSNDFCKRPSRR
jgi:hypothetical protein